MGFHMIRGNVTPSCPSITQFGSPNMELAVGF